MIKCSLKDSEVKTWNNWTWLRIKRSIFEQSGVHATYVFLRYNHNHFLRAHMSQFLWYGSLSTIPNTMCAQLEIFKCHTEGHLTVTGVKEPNCRGFCRINSGPLWRMTRQNITLTCVFRLCSYLLTMTVRDFLSIFLFILSYWYSILENVNGLICWECW